LATEVVRAVGPAHVDCGSNAAGGLDPNPIVHGKDVGGARRYDIDAGLARRVDGRAVELSSASDDEVGRELELRLLERNDGRAAARRVDEARLSNDGSRDAVAEQPGRDQREGASGHSAAARLLARMRWIDERDADAALRETVRAPRPGRSGADHRDIHRDKLLRLGASGGWSLVQQSGQWTIQIDSPSVYFRTSPGRRRGSTRSRAAA